MQGLQDCCRFYDLYAMLSERQTRSRTGKMLTIKDCFQIICRKRDKSLALSTTLLLFNNKRKLEKKLNTTWEESERATEKEMKFTFGIYTFDGVGSCYK